MNKKVYKSAINNLQFSEDLTQKTLNHLSSEGKKEERTNRRRPLISILVAACVLLIILGPKLFSRSHSINLPNSIGNVSVSYIKNPPNIDIKTELIWLSEEEIFTRFNTVIFKGTVISIDNIRMNFDGDYDYRAIAKIRVDKSYRGVDESIGEIVTVLLPCPINLNVWVEDTEIVSSLTEGTTGIFMPMRYNKESYIGKNNTKLFLLDLAEYGFADGMRFAFLETPDKVKFYREAFPSISNAQTLEDIEEYIMKMINQ